MLKERVAGVSRDELEEWLGEEWLELFEGKRWLNRERIDLLLDGLPRPKVADRGAAK